MYPDEVGESKIVSFMGFFHIEMASQECGGKLLAGSGSDRLFHLGNVFPMGTARSLLGSGDVKRTRYAYHLTLAFLHKLKLQAYADYCNECNGLPEPIQAWEERLSATAPTMHYWKTVTDYLLINCRFVRAQRIGDWPLALSAFKDLCPYFFILGHTNYARWLPVFLRDMARLPLIHPSVHDAFLQGKFVVQRSNKKFSLMALDQSQDSGAQHQIFKGRQWNKGSLWLSRREDCHRAIKARSVKDHRGVSERIICCIRKNE